MLEALSIGTIRPAFASAAHGAPSRSADMSVHSPARAVVTVAHGWLVASAVLVIEQVQNACSLAAALSEFALVAAKRSCPVRCASRDLKRNGFVYV